MKSNVLKHIRRKASDLAFNNALYNWTLHHNILGGSQPQGFVTIPTDGWPGDMEKGRWLCEGTFTLGGETFEIPNSHWYLEGLSQDWMAHIHGFSWLRDLRALGGDQARLAARALIESWIDHHHGFDKVTWQNDFTGERLSHWIGCYDFFGASAGEEFQDLFFNSLSRQARHLCRALPGDSTGIAQLKAIKGLAYCGIALEGRESWLEVALDLLQEETRKQIQPDGGHITRSPAQLTEALQIFIDIRCALKAAHYPVPGPMQHTIDRMAQALRFFRYSDKKLCVFNGAQEGDINFLEAVLSKSNARGKTLTRLPQSGYERLTLGRSVIMMDTGSPPAYPHERHHHAAPLAFEFIYGKERIFTSCGSHPFDPTWQDSLRATAAHNTLSIDHRNAAEIRHDGHFGRKHRKMSVTREDTHDACLIEATHDGYVSLNGITHRRRIYMGEQGHDIRGEDTLSCSIGAVNPKEIALRFHLHPRVLVSIIQDGTEALLRLPGGAGWRFHFSGGAFALENSIYLGEGSRPRKTKQLVLYGTMESDFARIKWGLQREGR